MTAPSDFSPNVGNYFVGKGIVLFKKDGDAVARDIGNVPEFEFTPSSDTIEHFSSREGVKSKDLTVIVSRGGELRMVMDESQQDNLSMILMGTVNKNEGVHAFGTLTSTANVVNGDAVTIGGKVYTFQTVLTDIDGNVFIGATAALSLANLSAAINLGPGSGTAYAASMTKHRSVTGNGASPLVVTAQVSGTGGNSIGTTETSANLSWGAATLAGGTVDSAATVGIFDQDTISGEVYFYGTNSIGPKWDYKFNKVDFLPTGSLNMISDEFGNIEVTGQVAAVNGVFGLATKRTATIAPENFVVPFVTGTKQVGQTLTVNEGTWRGQTSFTYQWKKNGVTIGGATSRTYVPVAGDAGSVLDVTVTALNATGSTSATSTEHAAIAA